MLNLSKDAFDKIVNSDKISLKNKEEQFNSKEGEKVLIEFRTTPYELLMDKLRLQIELKPTEKAKEMLYVRFLDTGEAWELGYINMTLDFWRFLEGIFKNYDPKFYSIKEDSLERLTKSDYIGTVKFDRGVLDEFIE